MTMPFNTRPRASTGQTRLWVEFLGFYVAAPVGAAVLAPPAWMFPMLFALTALGLALLALTPDFQWRELLRRGRPYGFWAVMGFALGVTLACLAIVQLQAPWRLWALPQNDPRLWAIILIFYPIVSALPQELVFRPLFFRRYGAILPARAPALVLNAALFSLAHLMYWNTLVAGMTFIGGLVFAHAYHIRGSFWQAVLLHALAGQILFTVGLGIYFYSGNVVRPF